jgi:hypothetical protein
MTVGRIVAVRHFGRQETFGDKSVGIFLKNSTPKQLVDLIDQKFTAGKQKGLSRFSIEWGLWSRQMNLYIQEKIGENGPKAILFKYAMYYWVLKSQMLELNFRSKIGKLGRKNKLKNEAIGIKKTILNPPGNLQDVSMDELAIKIAEGALK